MKQILKEFKEFISRGHVMAMAVGILIGGAFTGIVNSFVTDIINPILGIFGGMNFSDLKWNIVGDVTLNYGSFITAVINFLIMAAVLFAIIKLMNGFSAKLAIKKKEEEEQAAPTTKVCPFCKTEIAIDATRCPHCTSNL